MAADMEPEEVKEVYDALAKGETDVPEDSSVVDALMDKVFEARRSRDVRERMAALRVAEAVGERAGLDVIETFMQDPAIEVRRYAFNLGLAARADGLRIIREAAADPDPELAIEALRLLTVAADRSSATRARVLLSHDDPRVRAAAIRLLGHVAGPAVRRELDAQGSHPDEDVRAAVDEALQRIDGDLPKNAPGRWWDEPPDASKPPPPGRERAPDGTLSPETLQAVDTLDPDKGSDGKSPNDSTWGPEVDSEGPLWEPMVPEDSEVPSLPPGPAWNPDEHISLPENLPTHAYALLRLLGMVADEDHERLIEALGEADADALLENVNGHRPGKDPARGRGIGLAARMLKKKSWLHKVRRLLGDPEPRVREAAVQAVGALGGPSTLTQVSGLLQDENAQVRVAAVLTLGDACHRWGLLEILPQWLEQVAGDKDERVRAARDDVLARTTGGGG